MIIEITYGENQTDLGEVRLALDHIPSWDEADEILRRPDQFGPATFYRALAIRRVEPTYRRTICTCGFRMETTYGYCGNCEDYL